MASSKAAARGEAAFDRETSHYRKEIPDLRVKVSSIVPRFGQQTVSHTHQSPEPCSTQRTSRLAATNSKCRKKPSNTAGNTKPKQPPLRRRAAMTHAVHHHTSARAASLMDRATSHWDRAPPLDRGDDDDDADTRTDTTALDDDNASFTRQLTTALQTSIL